MKIKDFSLFFFILMPFTTYSKDISISYVILSHNETVSLKKLLDFLISQKDTVDEIVVIDDFSSNQETINLLKGLLSKNLIKFNQRKLNFNFASQRNYAKAIAKCDYIFSLDADEMPSFFLIKNLKKIIAKTRKEAYKIPRLIMIDGLRHPDVNKNGGFRWPDYQIRLFKNIKSIKWEDPVHEHIINFNSLSILPALTNYAILEKKPPSNWAKSHPLYEKCFKLWLAKCLKDKNTKKIKTILDIDTRHQLKLFEDKEVLKELSNNKNCKTIQNYISSLINKRKITDKEVYKLLKLINPGIIN